MGSHREARKVERGATPQTDERLELLATQLAALTARARGRAATAAGVETWRRLITEQGEPQARRVLDELAAEIGCAPSADAATRAREDVGWLIEHFPVHRWRWALAQRLKARFGNDFDQALPAMERAAAAIVAEITRRRPEGGVFESALVQQEWCGSHGVENYLEALGWFWTVMRYPEGSGPLELAHRCAFASPIQLLPLEGRRSWTRKHLASLAFHLQRDQGEKPILLPVEKLAGLPGIEVTPQEVGHCLFNLTRRDGVLECVDATFSLAAHKAKAWRFRLEARHRFRPPVDLAEVGRKEPAPD